MSDIASIVEDGTLLLSPNPLPLDNSNNPNPSSAANDRDVLTCRQQQQQDANESVVNPSSEHSIGDTEVTVLVTDDGTCSDIVVNISDHKESVDSIDETDSNTSNSIGIHAALANRTNATEQIVRYDHSERHGYKHHFRSSCIVDETPTFSDR